DRSVELHPVRAPLGGGVGDEELSHLFLALLQAAGDLTQDASAVAWRRPSPRAVVEGASRGGAGALHVGARAVGGAADDLPRRRVGQRVGGAVTGLGPCAVDVHLEAASRGHRCVPPPRLMAWPVWRSKGRRRVALTGCNGLATLSSRFPGKGGSM